MAHMPVGEIKDFFRVHPDEENYWSPELCFVPVPIKGEKNDTLHLIDEDLAMEFLPSGKIKRFRLALAIQAVRYVLPCSVPSQNLDNNWNVTALAACEKAKTLWTQASVPQRRRASTGTRSTWRAIRRLSLSRTGRSSRSMS